MKQKNQIVSKKVNLSFLILVVLLLTGIFGCNTGNNPMQPSGMSSNNLDLSAVTDNTTVGNLLVISEAKVMIKDMKIEMEQAAGGGEGEDEIFKTGPFVIDLRLDAGINLITNAFLKAGKYEKVKFEIHKLGPQEIPPDPDFSDDFGRYSVVVKGTYSGTKFIYKSKISANQKLNLQKILSVTANSANNLTFKANPSLWFLDDNGQILDPSLGINRQIIDHNIKDNLKHNIRIFIDDDHDGRPDS